MIWKKPFDAGVEYVSQNRSINLDIILKKANADSSSSLQKGGCFTSSVSPLSRMLDSILLKISTLYLTPQCYVDLIWSNSLISHSSVVSKIFCYHPPKILYTTFYQMSSSMRRYEISKKIDITGHNINYRPKSRKSRFSEMRL